MHANLFSESFQRRLLLERSVRAWLRAWLAAAVVAVVVAVAGWPATRSLRLELEQAELRSAPVAEKLAECEQLKSELARLAELRTKLRCLAPDSVPLGVLGLITAATEAANDDVQIRNVSYTAVKLSLQPSKVSPTPAHGSIVVHGLAANEAAAARFVEHLRSSPVLSHVELKASSRATTSSSAIQFDVICHL